jgi:hypothetical protein
VVRLLYTILVYWKQFVGEGNPTTLYQEREETCVPVCDNNAPKEPRAVGQQELETHSGNTSSLIKDNSDGGEEGVRRTFGSPSRETPEKEDWDDESGKETQSPSIALNTAAPFNSSASTTSSMATKR